MALAAAASLSAGPPISGTTTFGTGGSSVPLASGNGAAGVTATNVRGTGWDVHVTTVGPGTIAIYARDPGLGTGDAVYWEEPAAFWFPPLAAFRVSSHDGSVFDLQSFQYRSRSSSATPRLTGYRDGSPVAGATLTLPTARDLTTVDVSAYPAFIGIDAFEITPNGNTLYEIEIDNLTVANVRPPTEPVFGNLGGDAVTYVEDASAVRLDAGANATVTDPDTTNFDGATLTATIVANRSDAEDVLGLDTGGAFTVSGSNLQSGGQTFATFSGGTGSAPLVVSFTSSGTTATQALVQDVVRHLTYRNSNAADPSTATRTVRLVLTDGNGGTSPPADVSVTVIGVNDQPSSSLISGTRFFTEGDQPVDLVSDVSVMTVEAGQSILGMTVLIDSLRDGASERLHIDGTSVTLTDGAQVVTAGAGISVDVTAAGPGVRIVLSKPGGMSASTAAAVIDGLAYDNTSAAPSEDESKWVYLTELRDSGGTSDGGVDTNMSLRVLAKLSVLPVNDAPVNTLPGPQTITADTSLTFSAGLGTGLAVADVDLGANPLEVTLAATHGVLSLGGTAGLTFTLGTGTADQLMRFSGTLSHVNAALQGAVFTPAAGYVGQATVQITSDDLGATGSGGALTDTDVLLVTVEPASPVVTSVTSVTADGAYAAGQVITLAVAFDQVVHVTTTGGLPTLLLETGPVDRAAVYVGGSSSQALTFAYTVQPGDVSPDLDIHSAAALALNGAVIAGPLGAPAVLTLPAPGSPASLAAQAALTIDTDAPTLTISAPSVTTTLTGPVSFDLTYSGATSVTLTASDVTLLTTGTATATLGVSGSGTSVRTVTLSSLSGSGTLAIAVAAHTAQDAAGNRAAAVGASATVQVQGRHLTTVAPSAGLAEGGIAVTVTGGGFASLQAPVVAFGTTPATQTVVVSDSELRVITPELPSGSALDVTLTDASGPVATREAGYTPLPPPAGPLVDTDGDTLPDAWELRFGLDPLNPDDATHDSDGDGVSNVAEWAAGTHPRATWARGFAEGVVTDMFRTEVAIFNPGLERAAVMLRYLPEGAPSVVEVHELAPGRTLLRDIALVAGLATGAVAVDIDSNAEVVASSLTTWDRNAYGAGAETAVAPAATWYLAEGATHGPFDLFYVIGNPTAEAVDIDITFLRPAPEPPLVRRYRVAAHARLTLWVDALEPALANTDVSAIVRAVGGTPIVVERAMYAQDGSSRFGAAGHRAAGVPAPAAEWHLAEGYVGGPFDTYVLLANPNPEPATVTVDVLGEDGVVHVQTTEVAAGSRLTLYAGDMPIATGPIGFRVCTSEATPIVVERAMWWRGQTGGPWVESHASSGATAGAPRWALTDIRVGGARGESHYVLVQNLEATAVTVDVTLHLDDGTTSSRSYVTGGNSRLTVDVAALFPEALGRLASAVISASGRVTVELSRYWDAEGVVWSAGTNVRGTPIE